MGSPEGGRLVHAVRAIASTPHMLARLTDKALCIAVVGPVGIAIGAMFAIAISTNLLAQSPIRAQTTGLDAFVGGWEGEFYDSSGAVGGLEVTFRRPRDGMLPILVRAPTTTWGGFGGRAYTANGTLVVDQPNLRIILSFRFKGNEKLEADYKYRDVSNTGTWKLSRTRHANESRGDDDKKLSEALVTGSPWQGAFGYGEDGPQEGTLTQSFSMTEGKLIGEMTLSSGQSGPLIDVELIDAELYYVTPQGTQTVARFKDAKWKGRWFGRASGWVTFSSSKN